MKKILIIFSCFSLSFAGTMYFSNDFGDDKYMTLGYNHQVKDFGSWSLAVGASYDLSSDDGEGSANATFMNLYLLDLYPINEKISVFGTLGYSMVADEGNYGDCLEFDGDQYCNSLEGGLMYGLGMHYQINEKYGVGLGFHQNAYTAEEYYTTSDGSLTSLLLSTTDDTAGRLNIHFSYSF